MSCEFKITVPPPQTVKISLAERGPAGPPGSSIHAAEGPPTFEAQPGDLYLDTLTGDLYEWGQGWQLVGNLQGPPGEAGQDGQDGEDAQLSNAPASQVSVGAPTSGTADTACRADHRHSVAVGMPRSLTVGGSNATGSGTSLARSDHQHGLPAFGTATGTFAEGSDTRFPTASQALALLGTAGVPSDLNRYVTDQDARLLDQGTTKPHAPSHQDGGADELNVQGLAGQLAEAQLADRLNTSGTPVSLNTTPPQPGQVLQATSATQASWKDPTAPLSYGPPLGLDVGGSSEEGTATTVSRSDHKHAMPGLASPGLDGFFSGQDKQKLDTIAPLADQTLTALASASADISVNGQSITNLKTPGAANDAANKAYVDAAVTGLDVKQACRLLRDTNHPLNGLSGTTDGIKPLAGDRVLCIAQTNAALNGIYRAASGQWTRAPDADSDAEVTSGMYTFITEGDTYANTGWILTNPDPVLIGDALTFAQFSSAGSVVAGDGLTKVGQTLNITPSPDGSIVVAPDEIRVGVLASDAQHGQRGGGTQHALADAAQAGFLSSADWTKLQGNQIADRIATSGAPVVVDPVAPTAGQMLQAVSGTKAAWVTPAAGGGNALLERRVYPYPTFTGNTTTPIADAAYWMYMGTTLASIIPKFGVVAPSSVGSGIVGEWALGTTPNPPRGFAITQNVTITQVQAMTVALPVNDVGFPPAAWGPVSAGVHLWAGVRFNYTTQPVLGRMYAQGLGDVALKMSSGVLGVGNVVTGLTNFGVNGFAVMFFLTY